MHDEKGQSEGHDKDLRDGLRWMRESDDFQRDREGHSPRLDWGAGWAKGKRRAEDNPRGVALVLRWLMTPANFPGEYSRQAVVGKTKVSTRHIAYFCYCEKLQ